MTVPGAVGSAALGESREAVDWSAAWDAALRTVELDVAEAERLIDAMHAGVDAPDVVPTTDWVAPAALGQVPHEFAERARALLQRQLEVSDRLVEAMVYARSQRRGLSKFDAAERPPVFVDQAI